MRSGTVHTVEADDLRMQHTPTGDTHRVGERLIADHLDALEAERVIQRALELEAASLDEPHVITTGQLELIAKEIGIDPAFVHQALGEVRLESEHRGRVSRWILPHDLVATATIKGLDRDDVDASIKKWMTQNEGLTPGGILPDGIEWDVDRRWRARMISRSMSGGNRISRVASGDVAHRVHSVSAHEHVVAFQSTGRLPLLFAHITMAVGGALGAIALLGSTASGGVLNAVGFFALFAGLSVAVGLGGARWWAQTINAAMRRSLIGLVGSAKPKRKSWFARGNTKSLRRKKDS